MTEPPAVAIAKLPPAGLLALEVWGDRAGLEARFLARFQVALPDCGASVAAPVGRVLWWEPQVWLIRTTLDGVAETKAALEQAAGEDGAVTDVSGSFACLRLTGADWRGLLMIGGVFDAESPAVAAGRVAGTVIDHTPLRFDVVEAGLVHAYLPPSYAAHMIHVWGKAARQLSA